MKRPKFDYSITFGNVLSIVSMLSAILVMGFNAGVKIKLLETSDAKQWDVLEKVVENQRATEKNHAILNQQFQDYIRK